jgi:hypothetical protein
VYVDGKIIAHVTIRIGHRQAGRGARLRQFEDRKPFRS